jgi:nucleoside-diphosphate-sugar epimerase
MGQTIAITGATGFAGRHAVDELVRQGHRLRALVRTPGAAALPAAVEVIAGDLDDGAALDRLLSGADCVVHLAGAIAALSTEAYFRVNAHGTRALASAASRAGIRRFVHISSLSAREPGLSPYGASKRAGEDAVAELMDRLNAIILRPPAVYGPGDRGTLPLIRELTRPIAAIPGRREARFSLIHGRDLARLIARAATGGERGVHEVSDSRAEGYSWDDLIAVASAARGAPVRPVFLPRAVPFLAAIGSEALSRLSGKPGMVNRGKVAELYHRDWVCRAGTLALAEPISFADGFSETVAWYRHAGWLPPGRPADTRGENSRTSQ